MKIHNMKKTLFIIIVLIGSVCIIMSIVWLVNRHIDRQIYKQNIQETQLIRVMHTIDIGDTYGDILEKYYQVGTNDLLIYCDNPKIWTIAAEPFGFFDESDWQLLLEFEEKRVVSVKIRSIDGPYKPKGTPEDKVKRSGTD